jgi:hypothetical protein
VENELLKKQIEDLQHSLATHTPTRVPENAGHNHNSASSSRESEEFRVKLQVLREENQRLKEIDGERRDIEEQLVQVKIRSANLDLEND